MPTPTLLPTINAYAFLAVALLRGRAIAVEELYAHLQRLDRATTTATDPDLPPQPVQLADVNARLNLVKLVAADILKERVRQMAGWGDQTLSPEMWMAVLGEEVGEANQAVLHDQFGGRAAGTLYAEVTQVAAVAFSLMEALRTGRAGTRYMPTTPEDK